MLISQCFVEFIFYSFLGWVWESIYCSSKERKWADRGFLFGPICPIYGFCVVGASIVFRTFAVFSSPDFPLWGIFIICCIGSAVAEYSTSWVLEKRFHARWWDYSKVPLNINGRICVPASICFGLAGVAIIKYLLPVMEDMHVMINPLVYEVLALLFAVLLGADFALTEASLSSLLAEVERMHGEFNERAQKNYEKLASTPKLIGQKISEEKQLAELRRDRLLELYAKKLSFNQKRVLLGIQRFIPKTDKTYHIPLIHLTDALRENVRELRKKKNN